MAETKSTKTKPTGYGKTRADRYIRLYASVYTAGYRTKEEIPAVYREAAVKYAEDEYGAVF